MAFMAALPIVEALGAEAAAGTAAAAGEAAAGAAAAGEATAGVGRMSQFLGGVTKDGMGALNKANTLSNIGSAISGSNKSSTPANGGGVNTGGIY